MKMTLMDRASPPLESQRLRLLRRVFVAIVRSLHANTFR